VHGAMGAGRACGTGWAGGDGRVAGSVAHVMFGPWACHLVFSICDTPGRPLTATGRKRSVEHSGTPPACLVCVWCPRGVRYALSVMIGLL